MNTRLSLNGKTLAITGGAGGIGVELGRAALGRGARVALLDVGGQAAVRAAESLGGHTLGYCADVRDATELAAAFADIAAVCGGIDVLSANAEVLPLAKTADMTPAAAADALIRGIERRAPRTIYPARWKPPHALRGIAGPITDAYFIRNRRTQRLVADTRARESAHRVQPTETLE